VQRRYEFRRDSLSRPELRTLVQIPVRNAQAAAQVAQRLQAGENPNAIAQSLKVEPVRYERAPATAIADQRVAEAAFRLQPGQVSGPIQGQLGMSVVQVTAVVPGQTVTLEQARPALEAQIRAEAAQERVSEVIQRFEEAHEGGSTLVEAARAVNVPALSIAPISQGGRDERNQPVQLEPQLLQAAFEQPVGGESDIIEGRRGPLRLGAGRPDHPAAVPPLAAVRNELAQVWQIRQVRQRMQQRADALATQARGGAPLQTVAQQAGAPFTRFPGMQRASEGSAVPPEVAAAAFGVKQGEIFTAPDPQGGIIVGRVDTIRFPPAPQAAAGLEARRPAPVARHHQPAWAERARRRRAADEGAHQPRRRPRGAGSRCARATGAARRPGSVTIEPSVRGLPHGSRTWRRPGPLDPADRRPGDARSPPS
jgi:peptidyl-prolyl cis-trans isomerase D